MSTVDAEFALLHGLSPETLRVLVDLAPQLSSHLNPPVPVAPAHPASAPLRLGVVQECFRLRYEAAERRYARMKGLVHASIEAQQRMEREVKGLRVADAIVRLGLERECSATLSAMLAAGKADSMGRLLSTTMQDEVAGLTKRLTAALEQNEKLMHMNRELRGLEGLVDVPMDPSASASLHETQAALVETLRKRVIALELECNRLQSDGLRFEEDERLRECEDVFDQLLGRERQDYPETQQPNPLHRFHPVGTCKDPACAAYARRLRGGFKVAITEAYVRERVVRVNGLVRQHFEPLETLRVQKDAEIRALRERILRFEQAQRMTSEEADRVQLRAASMEILDKAAELDALRIECAAADREFTKRRGVLAGLIAEEEALKSSLMAAQAEMQGLAEERQMTIKVTNDFREEQSKLQQMRTDITNFQAGQQAINFRRHRAQASVLEIEVGNLRIERDMAEIADLNDGPGGPVQPLTVGGGGPASARTFAAALSGGSKRPRTGSSLNIMPSPDGIPLILCQCKRYIPLPAMELHVRQAHSGPRSDHTTAFLCKAGCGLLVFGFGSTCIQAHVASGECSSRNTEISRLQAAGRSGSV